jgi:hypothetical protein
MSLSSEYKAAWDAVTGRTWAHMFNMLIMKKSALDRYCEWLFDVLKYVEERVDYIWV